MSGGDRQDVKEYQQMLRYNLKAKSLFDNGAHAQQTPSSTYFLTDKITRESGVLLNLRQRLRLIKNPNYLRRSGIPLKEITPATILFPLSKPDERYYY